MAHGNGNGIGTTFTTTRLDLATKLALMSAVIFGASLEAITPEQAVEQAARINDLCDEKTKELKRAAV